MPDDLHELLQSNPDPRELKRAVAVQMFLKGYRHREIQEILGVSSGFISKWTQLYQQLGVSGLRLGYQGSSGYLAPEQRQAVISWLQSKNYWNLAELQGHIQDEYDVMFGSKQSYYTLFEQAGISWKKTQKRNPKEDPALVQKKNRKLRTGWRHIAVRLSLASWWSSSRMNAICCGETCVGMSGAKRTNGLKFPSSMSGASKLTTVQLTCTLSNVSFKPIKRAILSLPLPLYSICSCNVQRAVLL